MPILEGALERSVDLAAAMDSRGYGRTTVADPRARRITSALVVAGMLGVCLGLYGLLGGTEDSWLGLPALLVGVAPGVVGASSLGGRRTGRTRYRPDPWALPELLVVALRRDRRGADVLAGPASTRRCWSCPRRPRSRRCRCWPASASWSRMLPAVLAPPLPVAPHAGPVQEAAA